MRILIFLILLLPITKNNAQERKQDSIWEKELDEIIIKAPTSKSPSNFNLISYKKKIAAFLDCNDNVGIYIRKGIDTSSILTIDKIEFPIIDRTNGDAWSFNFFALIPYKDRDTLIDLLILSKEIRPEKLRYTFNKALSLKEPISGFYIFCAYACPVKEYHGNILLEYTEKFRSKLTYRFFDKKVILKNMKNSYQIPTGTIFDKYKFLNWKVDIEYSVD
jgi:hypothetical protein